MSEQFCADLSVFACPTFLIILGFLGLALGFLQESLFLAPDPRGRTWIPTTAIGLVVGNLITLSFTLDLSFSPSLVTHITDFLSPWVLPFALAGVVCSLFQVWALGKKHALPYLAVAWVGSYFGAKLGGLVNYKIQLSSACIPFLGIIAHMLIVIAVYGVVTSGGLYLLSHRGRSVIKDG
jgi:hypothetical protein